jgi:hypothetical protein
MTRDVAWNSCNANARHLSEDGKERVVICALEPHAAPGDTTEWHYDPNMGDTGIYWRFADDEWTSDDR